jgi:hypothetical protein
MGSASAKGPAHHRLAAWNLNCLATIRPEALRSRSAKFIDDNFPAADLAASSSEWKSFGPKSYNGGLMFGDAPQ